MSEMESTSQEKRTYDDISFEKRRKLIQLIESGKWTIRGAARQTQIKLCTAKYILYHYRKKGLIYDKKRGNSQADQPISEPKEPLNQIVYVPCPIYIFCGCPNEAYLYDFNMNMMSSQQI